MKYNSDESALRNTWTEEELRATVTAYLDMYKKELEGTTFVKKHYYAELAARFQRQGEIVNILLKIKNSFLPTKQILIGL